MQKYEQVERRSIKRIVINNFLGGIAWGLGATIGLALVLAIFGFIAKRINFVPVVGNFVTQVMQYSNQKSPQTLDKTGR